MIFTHIFQLRDILEKRKEEVRARHDELKNELSTERETVRIRESKAMLEKYRIPLALMANQHQASLHEGIISLEI